jgi:hypothetical protein
MQAQYGDNCLSHSKIYKWTDHFKKGKTSVCDEEKSGRPSTSRAGNNIQADDRMLWENRPITVDETLRGRRLSSEEEVIGAVQNWLKTQPKNFFSDGIKKL